MNLDEQQKIKYYKEKEKVDVVIKRNLKKQGHIVHGARALNQILPDFLDTPTEDYDIYAKKPKQAARRVEQKLDKAYGGDFFRLEKAQHPGTTKIKSNVTERTVADYTKPDRKVDSRKIRGIKYASAKYFKRKIKESLKNPDNKFRYPKDKEALQRIELAEKLKKQKVKQRRKSPKTFTELIGKKNSQRWF